MPARFLLDSAELLDLSIWDLLSEMGDKDQESKTKLPDSKKKPGAETKSQAEPRVRSQKPVPKSDYARNQR